MKPGSGGSFSRWMGIFLLIVFVVTAGLILYGLFSVASMPWNKIGQASALIASRSGLSIYLVKGVATLLSIPYFYAWSRLLPTTWGAINGLAGPTFDPLFLFRNRWGAIIVAYLAVFYIVQAGASRDAYAYKNCADTPEGVYMTDNTGKDPRYGQPLKPCTLAQIEEKTHPNAPKELAAAEIKQRGFFNISGYPQIWYTMGENGSYRLFDRGGTDREGDQLQQVTRAVAADWYRQQRHILAQRQSTRDQQQHAIEQANQQQALAGDSARAQQQYESGNFEQAIDSCKPVLSANPGDEDCRQLEHDASAKLARQLVDRAQSELQHGELEDAARNAARASKLDPDNGSAKNLRTVALHLIATSK